jgi:hypothetical protein
MGLHGPLKGYLYLYLQKKCDKKTVNIWQVVTWICRRAKFWAVRISNIPETVNNVIFDNG